jgi:hypothetical protein
MSELELGGRDEHVGDLFDDDFTICMIFMMVLCFFYGMAKATTIPQCFDFLLRTVSGIRVWRLTTRLSRICRGDDLRIQDLYMHQIHSSNMCSGLELHNIKFDDTSKKQKVCLPVNIAVLVVFSSQNYYNTY